MAYLFSSATFRGLFLAVLCAVLAGCAGVPAQEMSNARQAIKAARDAGASQVAPQKLNEAQSLLERAEADLQQRDFRGARRNAVQARGRATEALSAVQTANRNETG
jgi:sialic acid synthase SpsE